MGISGYIKL